MRHPIRWLLAAALFCTGCGDGPTSPTRDGVIIIGRITTGPARTVTTSGNPPGAFIARATGDLAIPLTIRASRDVPWAQLYVYLLTHDGYCAQNLPDAPTWGPFNSRETVRITITRFQVFRLPCSVIGIRAMLHTRNTGLLTPPTPTETIAEGAADVQFTIVRGGT